MESKIQLLEQNGFQIMDKPTLYWELSNYLKDAKSNSIFSNMSGHKIIGKELELKVGQSYMDSSVGIKSHFYRVALKFREIILLYDGNFLGQLMDQVSAIMISKIQTMYPEVELSVLSEVVPCDPFLLLEFSNLVESKNLHVLYRVQEQKQNDYKRNFKWILIWERKVFAGEHNCRFSALLMAIAEMWKHVAGRLPEKVTVHHVDSIRARMPIVWDD